MDAFRSLIVFFVICAIFAANFMLYNDKQGYLYSVKQNVDGWNLRCLYYTPFHLFETRVPVQMSCAKYESVSAAR
jgi:hypothetical protein